MFVSLFLPLQLTKTTKADLTRDLKLKSLEVQSETTSEYGNKLKEEGFRLEFREKSFHHEDRQTMEQVPR